MTSQRSIDSKREGFRKYLENAGVTDAIVQILTMVMDSDKPIADPLQFVRDTFERSSPLHVDQQYARDRIAYLEAENTKLKEELDRMKGKITTSVNIPADTSTLNSNA